MTAAAIAQELERVAQTLARQDRLAAAGRALLGAAGVAGLITASRVLVWPQLPALAAPIAFCLVAGVLYWRATRDTSVTPTDAALWVERHVPSLRYALVTLADFGGPALTARASQRLGRVVEESGAFRRAVEFVAARRRPRLTRVALGVAASALALAPWPSLAARRTSADVDGVSRSTASTPAAPGRVGAAADIVAPAYAGGARRVLAFGETVTALQGSVLHVDGPRDRADVAVELMERRRGDSASRARPVQLAGEGGSWRATVLIGDDPLAVRLRDPAGDRWLFIAPVADSAPVVTLDEPAEDVLLRDTTAVLALRGRAHDDIGLRDVRIEWIVSSGGGERFTFRSGVLAQRAGALGREQPVVAQLSLRSLALTPGDMVHLRITARDGNSISGPSLGASDTRTLRVPRADEQDSVAVEQLPPTPVEKNALSQRQLIVYTERLVARMPRIDRPTMLAESERIGAQQARLRKQVGEIIFARLGDTPTGEHAHFPGDGHNHSATELASQRTPEEVLRAAERATASSAATVLDNVGDETPVVAVNRPLLEAYNAMWEATRALQGGTPREALPPMRRALAAIQRARLAERVYLRGAPPAAIVDLDKIRLTGTDTARADARRPLGALPAPQRALIERLQRGIDALGRDPAAALDTLRLVRLDALADAPSAAPPLSEAIAALERGQSAVSALTRARRALQLVVRADGASALWGGGTP